MQFQSNGGLADNSVCLCVCVCTYVQGIEDNPGINQRALRLLFSEVLEKAPDWEYTITVSMVEIYNESLRYHNSNNQTFLNKNASRVSGGLLSMGAKLKDLKSLSS